MLVTENSVIEKYYNAVKTRDTQFIGTFFLGVKTTGIFCIPGCRARTPKLENIVFNTDSKELMQSGYRPCKICKPTHNAFEPPKEIIAAIELLNENPTERINDVALREKGLHPEKIRRWFKKNHGMSFHAYQRMVRINTAFQELKKGNKVTGSAYDSGYNSLSGFGYTFKNIVGSNPKKSINKNAVLISRITTPLGPMFICASDKGLCMLEFTDRKMIETEFKDIQQKLKAVILYGDNKTSKQTKQELKEYFSGKRKNFTVPLDLPGTDFQKNVWKHLQKIPCGKTISYQELAREIKNPKAVRAVANANGQNRVSIIVPCHRVIGKDGTLTGYGGGLQRKQWLLDHEKNITG